MIGVINIVHFERPTTFSRFKILDFQELRGGRRVAMVIDVAAAVAVDEGAAARLRSVE